MNAPSRIVYDTAVPTRRESASSSRIQFAAVLSAALIGRAVRDADGSAAADIRSAVTGLVSRHPAYSRE